MASRNAGGRTELPKSRTRRPAEKSTPAAPVAARDDCSPPGTSTGDSTEDYRRLIDALPQYVWTMRPDGVVDYVNQYFLQNVGLTRQQVDAGEWHRLLHPDDVPVTQAAWDKALQTDSPYEVEYRFRASADLEYRWFFTQCVPLRDASGAICKWLGTSADITDRKHTEAALRSLNQTLEKRVEDRTAAAERRSEELAASEQALRRQTRVLRSILDSAADGIVVADETGQLTMFTATAEQIIGRGVFNGPAEQWPAHYGCFLGDGVTPFPAEALPMARAIRGESCDDVDMVIRNPDRPQGVWLHITGRPLRDDNGKPQGGVIALRDVTGRKRQQDELKFRQSLLESLTEASIDGILVVDPARRIVFSNRRFARIWGIADESMMVGSDNKLLNAVMSLVDDPEPFLRRVDWLYAHPEETSRDEFRLKDGRTLDRYGAPIRGADGTHYGRVWFFHDVTQLKNAEESARRNEAHYRELAEHNRRLALEIDHRVGNNLQGLLALVQATRDRAANAQTFADAMEARLLAMAQVHILLRQSSGRRIELKSLIDATAAGMRYLVTSQSETLSDGPTVWISPTQMPALTMVLVEWFTNSAKYGAHSVPGGCVTIAWKVLDAATQGASRRLQLTWVETGGPPVSDTVVPSLGTTLVNGFVTRELAGRCTLRFPPSGVDHEIEFEVSDPADGM